MKHKKCGKELKSVSIWASHQVAQYERDNYGGWAEVPAPLEGYEDSVIEYYCNECGKALEPDEVEAFEKQLRASELSESEMREVSIEDLEGSE